MPGGPVSDIAQVLADPHLEARGYLVEVGGRRFPRTPLGLSRTPVSVERGAPRIGQHTREVLGEGGLTEGAIDGLARSGAILATEAQA